MLCRRGSYIRHRAGSCQEICQPVPSALISYINHMFAQNIANYFKGWLGRPPGPLAVPPATQDVGLGRPQLLHGFSTGFAPPRQPSARQETRYDSASPLPGLRKVFAHDRSHRRAAVRPDSACSPGVHSLRTGRAHSSRPASRGRTCRHWHRSSSRSNPPWSASPPGARSAAPPIRSWKTPSSGASSVSLTSSSPSSDAARSRAPVPA